MRVAVTERAPVSNLPIAVRAHLIHVLVAPAFQIVMETRTVHRVIDVRQRIQCTDLSFVGESCGGDAQCYSGQCVDGVCCESACEGECLACSQAKTGAANGLCRNVILGSDPDNECRDDGAASCGLNGSCGNGGCALYTSGTECAPETCIGDDLFGVRSCDGSGTVFRST